MNQKELDRIKEVANRTLKIVDLIAQGYEAQDIVKKTGANRQLVDYYIKRLK